MMDIVDNVDWTVRNSEVIVKMEICEALHAKVELEIMICTQ